MKTYKLACIIVTALFFTVIYPALSAPQVDEKEKPKSSIQFSAEAFGVVRSINIHDGEEFGAGAGFGVKFNRYVSGHLRLVSYETDNWRGSAIDEGSLLVEATLLSLANGKVSLSGIGGGDYDVRSEDFGFSVGPRVTFNLTKRVGLFAESRIRAWIEGEKDLSTSAGLSFKF